MRPKTWAARSRTPPEPSRLSINRRSPVRRTSTLATAAMLRMFKPFLAMQEEFGNSIRGSSSAAAETEAVALSRRAAGAHRQVRRPQQEFQTARVQNSTAHDHLRTHAGDWHGDDHLVSYPRQAELGGSNSRAPKASKRA